jgi:hypothetical protein
MSKRYKRFLKWLKSDNVIKTDKNQFRTQCSQYTILFTRKSLWEYYVREGYA